MKQNKPTGEKTKQKMDRSGSSLMKRSKLPNLFCDQRTGIYYAIARVASRRKSRSLKTQVYSEAARLLPGVLEEMRNVPEAPLDGPALTFREAIKNAIALDDPTIKESSKKYYAQCGAAILDHLPERVQRKPLAQVTTSEMRAWQRSYAKSYTPSRTNGAMSFLNRLFDRSIEAGHLSANPLDRIKRLRIVKTHRWIPSSEEFSRLIAEIRANANWRFNDATADAVELFAYTGLRLSEGQNLKWKAVKADHIEVQVSKDFRTKNDEMRSIPIAAKLRDLLERLRRAPGSKDPEARVMMIDRPTIGLANACKRRGFDHLRTHDLRHLFATRCIEGGVDIPTVAKWMGHKDGGVLISKTYSHILASHSAKQVEKVNF